MNREIKFRYWHKKEKRFVFLRAINFVDNTVTYDCQGECNYDDIATFNNITPQQFTGLLDKNGKDIYEGDFLSVENEIFLIVEWNKELGQFQQRNPQSGEQYDLSVYGDCRVVVGNIFKAPCNPDHNAECLVCDCWLSECPFRK